MKKLTIVILFSIFTGALTAQTSDTDFDYYNPEETKFASPVNEEIKPTRKPNIGLMTGTSIGTFTGKNSFVNTFVAPYLSYSLTPRLNINAAAMLGNTQFNYSSDKSFNQSFNSKNFMVGMDYKISNNTRIGVGFQVSQGMYPLSNQNGFSQFGQPFSPGISPFMAW